MKNESELVDPVRLNQLTVLGRYFGRFCDQHVIGPASEGIWKRIEPHLPAEVVHAMGRSLDGRLESRLRNQLLCSSGPALVGKAWPKEQDSNETAAEFFATLRSVIIQISAVEHPLEGKP